MASDKRTAARPYAKAAFEFALGDRQLLQWSVFLQAVALVRLDERVMPLLNDPRISNAQLFDLFHGVCEKWMGDKESNFLRLLTDNQRLNLLPEILELFESYRAEQEKTIDVDVASFMPLNDEQKERLRSSLKKRLQRDITLHCRIDESVLGGMRVRAGDEVIDNTVRSQLDKMHHNVVA